MSSTADLELKEHKILFLISNKVYSIYSVDTIRWFQKLLKLESSTNVSWDEGDDFILWSSTLHYEKWTSFSMKIWRKKDELIPGSEKQSLSFNLFRRALSFILAHSRATLLLLHKCFSDLSALSEFATTYQVNFAVLHDVVMVAGEGGMNLQFDLNYKNQLSKHHKYIRNIKEKLTMLTIGLVGFVHLLACSIHFKNLF